MAVERADRGGRSQPIRSWVLGTIFPNRLRAVLLRTPLCFCELLISCVIGSPWSFHEKATVRFIP